jgi:hypothetical protein
VQISGDKSKESAELLEVIGFDRTQRSYRFGVVNFNAAETGEVFISDAEEKDFSSLIHPSYHSFQKCNMCHALDGHDPVPRWSNGPIFQNAFGQSQGVIYPKTAQAAEWQRFLVTLNDPVKGERYRLVGVDYQDDGPTVRFPRNPNFSLAQNLEATNVKRVARLIEDSSNYEDVKSALIAVLSGPTNLEEILPPDQFAKVKDRFLNALKLKRETKQVRRDSLTSEGIRNIEAMKRSKPNSPDMIRATRYERVVYSRLSFFDAVVQIVREANESSLTTALNRSQGHITSSPIDLGGVVINGVDVSSLSRDAVAALILKDETEIMRQMAAVYILFEGAASEEVENWSSEVSFPFGHSFRFTSNFMASLLAEIRSHRARGDPTF